MSSPSAKSFADPAVSAEIIGLNFLLLIKQKTNPNLLYKKLNEIVEKTRNGNISPDDLQGSTFTLSNFGIFDALIGTPIINQPNVGILGTGKIIKKPVVIEKDDKDIIAIRNMMMLSLGFDHRLIDGAGGAKFLLKIKTNFMTTMHIILLKFKM